MNATNHNSLHTPNPNLNSVGAGGGAAADSTSWQQHWQADLMDTYGTPQRQLVSGSGAHVTDSEGNTYLDLLAGIAVTALGHGHPAMVDAVTKQISTLVHTSNVWAHPQVLELATQLKLIVAEGFTEGGEGPAKESNERCATGESHPAPNKLEDIQAAKVFFCNSGAEANEAAFKIARATGRPTILAAERGFHGRTMGSLALTGQPDKRAPFEPMPAGVKFYTYGDIESVRALADENTAAIFLESIQGETGVIPAPAGFLADLRALCDELGILLVIDEVQAGMGRTGQWFGFHHDGVLPDVITMAKGLGGGLPIGAVMAMPRAQLLTKGKHGTTFGGNPVVAAAANAVIRTIKDENLLDNVNRQGEALASALVTDPSVVEVRGRGLMLGVVLDEDLRVDPLDFGLILNRPSPNVLRIVPPLNLTAEDAQEGVEKLKKMLQAHRDAPKTNP
ncbi:acetylornithine transaminase [Corynebacterium auriscanis]|uniref:acetylornithine transaminase n=1 Tax=Corynebacterium auriscanis TaxID=99807 RepID=UPI0025B507C0|nr:acetylornithine transaminase [Corynebacterium auriscanis]WJY72593.1 Acetylornithine aminotransferase [Corynebacterium auriscanis]